MSPKVTASVPKAFAVSRTPSSSTHLSWPPPTTITGALKVEPSPRATGTSLDTALTSIRGILLLVAIFDWYASSFDCGRESPKKHSRHASASVVKLAVAKRYESLMAARGVRRRNLPTMAPFPDGGTEHRRQSPATLPPHLR